MQPSVLYTRQSLAMVNNAAYIEVSAKLGTGIEQMTETFTYHLMKSVPAFVLPSDMSLRWLAVEYLPAGNMMRLKPRVTLNTTPVCTILSWCPGNQ